MKRPYHIVTRAARESVVVIEQFCRANGQILLPILKLIENASQVVETVIHEIGHQTNPERPASGRSAYAGQGSW